MSTDNNVTSMPTPLERLRRRLDVVCQHLSKNRTEWVDYSLEVMQILAEARGHFQSDRAFGAWLKENKHDFSHQARAALIGLATDLDLASKILNETTRRSYEHIWHEHKSQFTHMRKPESRSADKTADSDTSESDTSTSDTDPEEHTYTPREKPDSTDQQSNQKTMSDHWRDPKSLTKAVKTTCEFIFRYEQEMPKKVALEYMNEIILRLKRRCNKLESKEHETRQQAN